MTPSLLLDHIMTSEKTNLSGFQVVSFLLYLSVKIKYGFQHELSEIKLYTVLLPSCLKSEAGINR